MSRKGKIVYFKDLPDNMLNKWVLEDITEDAGGDDEIYNLSYFLKTKNGLMSFGFMQYESPPLINKINRMKPDAFIEDPVILSPIDKRHPYSFADAEKVQIAMIAAVLTGELETEVI